MAFCSASHSRAADCTSVLSTVCKSKVELEHVGGGGLLLQRFAQFVEKARVLDCDHRLVGEGFDQLDLLFGKRPHRRSLQDDDADWRAFAEKRDRKRGTYIELRVAHCVIWVGTNIWDMNDLAFEKGAPRHRASTRGDRISFH